MSSPEIHFIKLQQLFEQLRNGTIKIPQFQRRFFWNKEQSARLLDSIVKGYPIGTLILWIPKERLPYTDKFCGIDFPNAPVDGVEKYVVDGQQRLASLFAMLNGLQIDRKGRNVDFSQIWFDLDESEVNQLVSCDNQEEEGICIRLQELMSGDLDYYNTFTESAQQRIEFFKSQIENYQLPVIEIADAPIDIVTDIYIRLNGCGKPLTHDEHFVAHHYWLLHTQDLDACLASTKDVHLYQDNPKIFHEKDADSSRKALSVTGWKTVKVRRRKKRG